MMVRPKKDPGKFPVILDLSFPLGESVNSCIPSLSFDGAPYKLRLPSALHMAELIAKHSKGCYIYKLDLARAYRQLPSDSLDWPLLGIFWEKNYYVDKSGPLGLRHWALCCERVTCAICYAAKIKCLADLIAYMGGAAGLNLKLAEVEFYNVCQLIQQIGLDLSLREVFRYASDFILDRYYV